MNRLNRSIGLMQALAVLLVSLLVGAALSAVHLQRALTHQRASMHGTADELLTLTQPAATNAAWTLDEGLARDVIANIVAMPGLRSAQVNDEYGQVLAEVSRPPAESRALRDWIRVPLKLDHLRQTRQLQVTELGSQRVVGELAIEIDGDFIADRFLTEVQYTVLITLTQALFIGAVLLWLSSRLVTGPLRNAAAQIKEINPDIPSQIIDVPARHKNNELGQLLWHTNGMLSRLFSAQEELRRVATRDALTNLPNRTAISEALDGAVERAKRSGSQVAVLFVDLDGFKEVNDVLGHETGDALLCSIAASLRATLRESDTVGRLGGDEFLVVLEGFDSVDAVVDTAARIATAIAGTIQIGEHPVRRSSSIGIALYPDDGADVGTLMRHADLAMYRAKDSGGGTAVLFAREMSEIMQSRLATRSALDQAISNDELFLVYQPKFSNPSRSVVGCEALLRWNRDGETVSAGDFLEVAENTSQMIDIGRLVLDKACAQISAWADQFGPVQVAVNVSARQLADPSFLDDVTSALSRHAVAPGLLELEITETAALADIALSIELLSRLRSLGVSTSLDDFGTGYSSLSYLVQLPLTTLKIDRAFVSGEHPSPVMLQAILAMAGALGLETVAEGVETNAQLQLVTSLGCTQVQGFFTGRPALASDFEQEYLAPKRAVNYST